MMQEDLVREVYRDLQALRAEAAANRDSPRFIRMIDNLLRLTDLDGEGQESAPVKSITGTDATFPGATATAVPCTHPSLNIYGRCQKCNECQHTNIKHGICITCDKKVPAPSN